MKIIREINRELEKFRKKQELARRKREHQQLERVLSKKVSEADELLAEARESSSRGNKQIAPVLEKIKVVEAHIEKLEKKKTTLQRSVSVPSNQPSLL